METNYTVNMVYPVALPHLLVVVSHLLRKTPTHPVQQTFCSFFSGGGSVVLVAPTADPREEFFGTPQKENLAHPTITAITRESFEALKVQLNFGIMTHPRSNLVLTTLE